MNANMPQQLSSLTNPSGKKTMLIFSANYLPNIGGVEKFTCALSNELEKIGHHAIIVTNNVFDLADHGKLYSGAEIYRLPCFSLIEGRLPIPRKNAKFRKLLKSIMREEIDYVLINTRFYPHSLLGAKIAQKKNITPVIIDHGSAYLTLNNAIADPLIKAHEHTITTILKRYHGVYYGISHASLKWLRTFRIEGQGVINNSIDADAFLRQASKRDYKKELYLASDNFLICFTGRLIPEKGIIPLLECAEYFANADRGIHFAFAGDGPLKKYITEKRLPNTHLLGKMNAPDIASLLLQSDAFCLPTRSEGFSTSLLEAAACYTAPIITNVGGVSELIPSPDYGIILKTASKESLTSAILDLATNKERTHQIGQNIGERVREQFSWRDTATKVLNACHNANY